MTRAAGAIGAIFVVCGCAEPAPGPVVVVDGAPADCRRFLLVYVIARPPVVRFEVQCGLDPIPEGIDDECNARFFVESRSPLALGAHPIDVEAMYSDAIGPLPQEPASAINRAGGQVQRAWASGESFGTRSVAGSQLATGVLDVRTLDGLHATGRLTVELAGRSICNGAGTVSSADVAFDAFGP